jgi:hypothetical protein
MLRKALHCYTNSIKDPSTLTHRGPVPVLGLMLLPFFGFQSRGTDRRQIAPMRA